MKICGVTYVGNNNPRARRVGVHATHGIRSDANGTGSPRGPVDGGDTMTDDERASITRRNALALGGLAVGGGSLAGVSLAQQGSGNEPAPTRYRVTVANLTKGQPFTPPVVAAHQPEVEVFAVGNPASGQIQALAENGNFDPLLDLVMATDSVVGASVGNGPLVPESDPGNTGNPYYTTVELSADETATHLSFVSMLVATNDGIVGLDTVPLPDEVNTSRTYYANGYDVGTEQNTERFEDLVPEAKTLIIGGQPEGTTESNPEIAEEGVIRPHPGIEGDGNLSREVYDWREPAALVQVEALTPTSGAPGTETPGTETPGTETPGTDTPGTETEGPGTETEGPGTETEGPGTETEGPGTETEGPGTETEGPGTETEGPGTETEAPGTETEAPGTDTEAPGTDTEAPGTDTEAPGTESPAPGTETEAPGTDTAAPGTDTAAPGTESPGPGTETETETPPSTVTDAEDETETEGS